MLHRVAVVLAVSCAFAVAVVASSASGAVAPVAHSSRSCTPPRYPGNGYFTTLSVSHTSCRTGRRLVVAYYRCRRRHGVRGRCHRRVLGYRCRERRQSISTEFDARVTCTRGRARIVHTYQQNT